MENADKYRQSQGFACFFCWISFLKRVISGSRYHSMHTIPRQIEAVLRQELTRRQLSRSEMGHSLKWCRFFIDFCLKSGNCPREPDSIPLFLKKIASKGQGSELQKQARAAVQILQELLPQFQKGVEVTSDEGREAEAAQSESGPAKVAVEKEGDQKGVQKGEIVKEAGPSEFGLSWEVLHHRLEDSFASGHYARTTRKSYLGHLRGYEAFLAEANSKEISSESAAAFLTYLAKERRVSASSQNQAFNALLFLFRKVLEQPFEPKGVQRVKRRRYVPVILSEEEVSMVFSEMEGVERLVAQMLYGSGLRLAECLSLRVQSLDFDQLRVTIHRGKGGKDRAVPMSKVLVEDLKAQLERCRSLYEEDLAAGFAGAFSPETGSPRVWERRMREWSWQFLFPQENLTLVPEKSEQRRYHFHETTFSNRLKAAVRRTRIHKRVTAHTFRHSFASHLLMQGHDIRSIQEVLGHSDIKTTMIYLQTVPAMAKKEMRSPFDQWG